MALKNFNGFLQHGLYRDIGVLQCTIILTIKSNLITVIQIFLSCFGDLGGIVMLNVQLWMDHKAFHCLDSSSIWADPNVKNFISLLAKGWWLVQVIWYQFTTIPELAASVSVKESQLSHKTSQLFFFPLSIFTWIMW